MSIGWQLQFPPTENGCFLFPYELQTYLTFELNFYIFIVKILGRAESVASSFQQQQKSPDVL